MPQDPTQFKRAADRRPVSQRARKFELLCDRLSEMARELGPNGRMPTVVQMRTALGVGSMSTLDKALGELESRNVIYRRQGNGIFVSPYLYQKKVCIVWDDAAFLRESSSSFWSLVLGQMHSRAQSRTDALSLHFAMQEEHNLPLPRYLMEDIQAGRVHGVLAIILSETALNWLKNYPVPTVTFGCFYPWAVVLASSDIVREGIKALASRGCRRIGLWCPVLWAESAQKNQDMWEQVFRQAMDECGLAVDERLIRAGQPIPLQPGDALWTPQEQGARIASEVFGAVEGARPDGIVCSNDLMMQGGLTVLLRLGVRLGADLQIATHANRGSMVFVGLEDVLTRIEFDPAEMVDAMFQMLDPLMAGETPAPCQKMIRPRVRGPEPHPAAG